MLHTIWRFKANTGRFITLRDSLGIFPCKYSYSSFRPVHYPSRLIKNYLLSFSTLVSDYSTFFGDLFRLFQTCARLSLTKTVLRFLRSIWGSEMLVMTLKHTWKRLKYVSTGLDESQSILTPFSWVSKSLGYVWKDLKKFIIKSVVVSKSVIHVSNCFKTSMWLKCIPPKTYYLF